MTDNQWFYLMLGSMAVVLFVWELVAALVYGWAGSAQWFLAVALGLAILFTIAAIATRTLMMGLEIVANFAVALCYGVLLPWLTRM